MGMQISERRTLIYRGVCFDKHVHTYVDIVSAGVAWTYCSGGDFVWGEEDDMRYDGREIKVSLFLRRFRKISPQHLLKDKSRTLS